MKRNKDKVIKIPNAKDWISALTPSDRLSVEMPLELSENAVLEYELEGIDLKGKHWKMEGLIKGLWLKIYEREIEQ